MIKVITAFFEGPERECSKCIKRPENGFANANASTPVATAVDIKEKYNAKCGTPSAGSPKVFFIPASRPELLGNIITHAPTVQKDCRGIFISINREFTPPFSSLRKDSNPRTVQLCGHSGGGLAELV